MNHPSEPTPVMTMAKALANVLDKDPVLAAQVKEHIPVERLLKLLDLPEDKVLLATIGDIPKGDATGEK